MTLQEQIELNAAISRYDFRIGALSEAMASRKTIVFIFARWSGTSLQSWRALTKALSTLERIPEVIVIDADEIPLQ